MSYIAPRPLSLAMRPTPFSPICALTCAVLARMHASFLGLYNYTCTTYSTRTSTYCSFVHRHSDNNTQAVEREPSSPIARFLRGRPTPRTNLRAAQEHACERNAH